MGLFSGGNSSSSNTTNNYETNLDYDYDLSRDSGFQDSGGLAAVAGDRNFTNIEVLDNKAIESALDFAEESQALYGQNFSSALGLVEDTTANSIYALQNSVDTVARFGEDTLYTSNQFSRQALDEYAYLARDLVESQADYASRQAENYGDILNQYGGYSEDALYYLGEQNADIIDNYGGVFDQYGNYSERVLDTVANNSADATRAVMDANTNSVVAQRNLITAFADKNASDATAGASDLYKTLIYGAVAIAAVFLIKG